jgi:hypothetical protein
MAFAKGKGTRGRQRSLKTRSPSVNNTKQKRRDVRLKRQHPQTMLLADVTSETHLINLVQFASSQQNLSHFKSLKYPVRTRNQRNLLTTCLFVPDTSKELDRKYEEGMIRLLEVLQENKLWHLRVYIDHSWQFVPSTLQSRILTILQDSKKILHQDSDSPLGSTPRLQLVFVLHPAQQDSLVMTTIRFLPFGEIGRGHTIVSTVDIDQTPTTDYLQLVSFTFTGFVALTKCGSKSFILVTNFTQVLQQAQLTDHPQILSFDTEHTSSCSKLFLAAATSVLHHNKIQRNPLTKSVKLLIAEFALRAEQGLYGADEIFLLPLLVSFLTGKDCFKSRMSPTISAMRTNSESYPWLKLVRGNSERAADRWTYFHRKTDAALILTTSQHESNDVVMLATTSYSS